MSISSALVAAQGRVADAYTAISNKGGTLPATQNLANMPTAINSIPSGGSSEKYGANVNTLLGDVNANGILQQPTEQSDLVFTGVKDVVNRSLAYKFYYNPSINSVDMPDLISITGMEGIQAAFQASGISSFTANKLKTITGDSNNNVFFNCINLTSVSVSELETIYVTQGWFNGCSSLAYIYFPKLKAITGNNGFSNMFGNSGIKTVEFQLLNSINNTDIMSYSFANCRNIENIYFHSLTTTSFGNYNSQFNDMFDSNTASTSGAITMHFPSNLSNTIARLTGYPNFGATAGRLPLAFDLPATE